MMLTAIQVYTNIKLEKYTLLQKGLLKKHLAPFIVMVETNLLDQ